MESLTLPLARCEAAPAFTDADSARVWLATLSVQNLGETFAALRGQAELVDASDHRGAPAIAVLNLLRANANLLTPEIEPAFTRKALPLPEAEARTFDAVQGLWGRLAIAYLRHAPECTPTNRVLPLHHAAHALRMAERCHFLAARTIPDLFARLHVAILSAALAHDALHKPVVDPDFTEQGMGTVSGQLSWALLIRAIEPYRLTAIQLKVVNRILSRWRELVAFMPVAASAPETGALDLASLLGVAPPDGVPHHLDIRAVQRKIARRIESLHAGESPESLKMGRELSAAASIRLLKDVDRQLRARNRTPSRSTGDVELAFGAERAYTALTNRVLNPNNPLDAAARAMGYQRMALFGFESASQIPNAVKKKMNVPSEVWRIAEGMVWREPDDNRERLLSPCLVAGMIGKETRLGVLSALRSDDAGQLSARIGWYDEGVETGSLKNLAPRGSRLLRVPVFLVRYGNDRSLILPPDAGVRLGIELELTGLSVASLIPDEVLERGTDFVRYGCRP